MFIHSLALRMNIAMIEHRNDSSQQKSDRLRRSLAECVVSALQLSLTSPFAAREREGAWAFAVAWGWAFVPR
jgi:hypothetical protein